MPATPSGAHDSASRPWLRDSWDAPDVLRFYAGSPFSNFARSPIWLPCSLDADVLVEHPTVEHAFQAAKATGWPDFRRVWLARTPAEAKRIGRREIAPRADWATYRFHAMLAALRARYQIPRFRDALLAMATARSPKTARATSSGAPATDAAATPATTTSAAR